MSADEVAALITVDACRQKNANQVASIIAAAMSSTKQNAAPAPVRSERSGAAASSSSKSDGSKNSSSSSASASASGSGSGSTRFNATRISAQFGI